MDKNQDTEEVSMKEETTTKVVEHDNNKNEEEGNKILKLLNITSPSSLEKSLLQLYNHDDNNNSDSDVNVQKDEINIIRYTIDTCFLSRVCEALSLFPKGRFTPDEGGEENEVEDLKVADGESSLSLNDKKRAKVENSDSDTTALLASSKIADYEEKLIGLVSDIAGILSNVTEQLKEKGSSSVIPILTVSDVVDRCTKNISCESTRKAILVRIGEEMPCFGVVKKQTNEDDDIGDGEKRLTRMLAKVLLSILSEVQLIYNLYQKFDAIWKEFALTNDSIGSIIDMDMARQIAWTMQSILSVDRFAGADYRINLMAASSYITAQLCHSLSSTNSNHHNSNKSTKLQQ